MAFLEGFYYNARIDKKILRERHEGLIALSACLGGEVAQSAVHEVNGGGADGADDSVAARCCRGRPHSPRSARTSPSA